MFVIIQNKTKYLKRAEIFLLFSEKSKIRHFYRRWNKAAKLLWHWILIQTMYLFTASLITIQIMASTLPWLVLKKIINSRFMTTFNIMSCKKPKKMIRMTHNFISRNITSTLCTSNQKTESWAWGLRIPWLSWVSINGIPLTLNVLIFWETWFARRGQSYLIWLNRYIRGTKWISNNLKNIWYQLDYRGTHWT